MEGKPVNCPGCNGDHVSIAHSDATGWYFGFCDTCGWEGPADLDKIGAIEKWNHRAREDALASELREARSYSEKLAGGLPDGTLPKDVELLRDANSQMATEINELNAKCATMYAALEFYANENNYDDSTVSDDRGETAARAMNQAQEPGE